MNRREFFEKGTGVLSGSSSETDLKLSGEMLYMRCLDAQTIEQANDNVDAPDMIDGLPTGGEPPTIHDGRSRQDVFDALERALMNVRVLRVSQSQWLVGEIRRDFDRVMTSFRARGGRVILE